MNHNIKLSSFEADLLTLPTKVASNEEGSIKYILVVIDTVTKMLFGAFMKRKFSGDVISGFDAILDKIRKLQANHPSTAFLKQITIATDYGKTVKSWRSYKSG